MGRKGKQSKREYSSEVLSKQGSTLHMQHYQRRLYMWTGLQKCQNREEGLVLSKTSIFKHLQRSCSIRRVQISIMQSSSSVNNLAQRFFLDSLRESNPRAILSSYRLKCQVLVVSIGIQLRVSVTVGHAIDRLFLPCRGAPTYPPRSLNSGRTYFSGSCPASAKQHATTRPNT
jgi:hypothetical protein